MGEWRFFCTRKNIFKYLKNDQTVWEKEPLENLAKDNQLFSLNIMVLASNGHS